MSMTLVAILGLGVAGNVMEASWRPAEFTAPAEFHDVQGAPAVEAPVLRDGIEHQEVTVDIDGEPVGGLVYVPQARGPHPAVLFVHGAGTKDRSEFEEQAEYLARTGIVAMVLDKRTAGYSAWHRDYEEMAGDVLAAVDALRQRSDVDPEHVGLFAESEGTWVAPIAAVEDPDIAFLLMVSAPIVAPAQQATYATLMALEGLDVPEPVKRAVAKGIGTALSLPNLLEYATFDVLRWVKRVDQPILMIYGTADPALPIVEGAHLVRNSAAGEVTVRYFAGAQHGIRIGDVTGPFAPGYLDTLATWITDRDTMDLPGISGGQPEQTLSAEAAPQPRWYATAYAHIAVLALAAAGYLAGPIASTVSRIRRGRGEQAPLPRPLRRRLRWMRALGAASLGGLVAYFIGLSHLALNHLTSPLLTYGVWALVWLVTAGAVMTLVSLWYDDSWRRPNNYQLAEAGVSTLTRRLTRVEMIALNGAVGGTILLLLIVTYWGVFLGI
ncbi:MAG TPA: alpha/beta hydrolase [Jiangellaceae bacterium]